MNYEFSGIVIGKGLRNRMEPLAFSNIQGVGVLGKFLINKGGNLSATYSKPYIVKYHISRIGRSLIRSAMSTVRGIRMRHVVTQNFNKANPCEELADCFRATCDQACR